MCYNNSQKAKIKELAKRYGRQIDIIEAWERIIEERKANGENVNNYAEEASHISAFVAPECSIITDNREILLMQWGMIPSMTKISQRKISILKGTGSAMPKQKIYLKPGLTGI